MKKLYILLFIGCSFLLSTKACAQGIFAQNQTQTKRLLEQIAQLKIYLGYVKKGYNIVQSGLNTVHSIKNGEFSLHDLYYTSLELVNPRIRSSPKAMGIISHQRYIFRTTSALQELLRQDNPLRAGQKEYLTSCIQRLLDDVEKTRQQLLGITTDKTFRLTDNERLDRLNDLYENSSSQFVFTQQFATEIFTIIKTIQKEQADDQWLKALHDLP